MLNVPAGGPPLHSVILQTEFFPSSHSMRHLPLGPREPRAWHSPRSRDGLSIHRSWHLHEYATWTRQRPRQPFSFAPHAIFAVIQVVSAKIYLWRNKRELALVVMTARAKRYGGVKMGLGQILLIGKEVRRKMQW